MNLKIITETMGSFMFDEVIHNGDHGTEIK